MLIHRAMVTRNGVFMFYLDLCEIREGTHNVYRLFMKDDDDQATIEHKIQNDDDGQSTYETASKTWIVWRQKYTNMGWETETLVYNKANVQLTK